MASRPQISVNKMEQEGSERNELGGGANPVERVTVPEGFAEAAEKRFRSGGGEAESKETSGLQKSDRLIRVLSPSHETHYNEDPDHRDADHQPLPDHKDLQVKNEDGKIVGEIRHLKQDEEQFLKQYWDKEKMPYVQAERKKKTTYRDNIEF